MGKILAFSGSARTGSFNQKLVAIASEGAKDAGADVTLINLRDYPMPLYNGDLEAKEGLPENALKFKSLLLEHDALLIASPEYNSAFSPLLKNVIDWASRPHTENEAMLSAYKGKVAGIMATGPGALGGMRGLVFLRMLLENINVMVLPAQKAIPFSFEAFNEDDNLKNSADQSAIKAIGSGVAHMIHKLKS